MDRDKINKLGYRIGQFIALLIIACITVLICTALIALTARCIQWMWPTV